MNQGFVQIPRDVVKGFLDQIKPKHEIVYWRLWFNVNWNKTKANFNGEIINLEPGQMVTSYQHLSGLCGSSIGVNCVRTAINKFVNAKRITYETTSQGSLLTLLDWPEQRETRFSGTNELTNDQSSNQQANDNTLRTNNKENNSESQDELPGPTPTEFRDYWTDKMPDYMACYMTEKRKAKLRTRRTEKLFVNNWKKIIDKASQSDFLTGSHNKGPGDNTFFDASWVLKNDDNYTKILEGKYDDQETTDDWEKRAAQTDYTADELKALEAQG